MVTIHELEKLTGQWYEIIRRVANGSLEAGAVKREMQRIIEGNIPPIPAKSSPTSAHIPSWYVSPREQITHLLRISEKMGWGLHEADMPPVPQAPDLRTNADVVLLNVLLPAKGTVSGLERTFTELWNLVQVPQGYTKHLLMTEGLEGRLSGSISPATPHVEWVIFTHNTYRGLSPESTISYFEATELSRLAGTEVLMAMVLFPRWLSSWDGDNNPYPCLAALSFDSEGRKLVPYLQRSNTPQQIVLGTAFASKWYTEVWRSLRWASPTVRPC